MNDYVLIYLVTFAGKLNECSQILLVLSFIAAVIYIPVSIGVNLETNGKVKLFRWWATLFPIVFGLLYLLTPSLEQSAAIYLLPKIKDGTVQALQSDTANTLSSKLFQVLEKKLDDELSSKSKKN